MSRIRVIKICLLLCLLVFSQIIAARNRRQQESGKTQLLGRTTAQQAIELSKPVFVALLPQSEDLYLTAEPSEMLGRDYRQHRFWNVQCVDDHGMVKAHLTCDADSGAVILVGCLSHPARLPRSATQESASEATARAQTWLKLVGYAGDWRPITTPKHGDRVWRIVMARDDQQALLSIDADNGRLMSASIRPR